MKRVIVLFALIAAFSATSFAQTDAQAAPNKPKMEKHKGGGKGGKHAGAGMDMKKQLNLTAEQETKMKTIGGTYRGKMKAIKSDNTLNKDQKKAQFAELQKAHDAEIKGVLNGDQYAKFTDLKKQRRDNMKAHKGGKGGKVRRGQQGQN